MYTVTYIAYPFIIKKYPSVDDLIAENGYENAIDTFKFQQTEVGIDVNDSTRVIFGLTEDGYKGSIVVNYDSEEQFLLLDHSGSIFKGVHPYPRFVDIKTQ